MNVITNAGSVGRRIVGPKDCDVLAPAQRRLDHHWNQVRLRRVVLAENSGAIAAADVKVAEVGKAEGCARAGHGFGEVADDVLAVPLAASIRAERRLRRRLRNRDVFGGWLAIRRAT